MPMQSMIHQACIPITMANGFEIQSLPAMHSQAGTMRTSLAFLFPSGQLPSTCSICLEALHLDKASEDSLNIILPECLHAFHLICLGEWQCHKYVCPDCRSPLSGSVDQMLLAAVLLHGELSVIGQACKRICERLQARAAAAQLPPGNLLQCAGVRGHAARMVAVSVLEQLGGASFLEMQGIALVDINPDSA